MYRNFVGQDRLIPTSQAHERAFESHYVCVAGKLFFDLDCYCSVSVVGESMAGLFWVVHYLLREQQSPEGYHQQNKDNISVLGGSGQYRFCCVRHRYSPCRSPSSTPMSNYITQYFFVNKKCHFLSLLTEEC